MGKMSERIFCWRVKWSVGCLKGKQVVLTGRAVELRVQEWERWQEVTSSYPWIAADFLFF